jgi:hypothetical protein
MQRSQHALEDETPCAVCPHSDGQHLIGGGRCAEPGCLCRVYAAPRPLVLEPPPARGRAEGGRRG